MSGGKGGSQTTEASIPDWARAPTIRNLARAEAAQQIGYQPYMGPDLAAFNPMQEAAFQSQIDAANAFGFATPSSPFQGMPEAQDFGGGVMGYSAFPIFEQAQQELAQRNPEQQARYDALFGGTGAQYMRNPFASSQTSSQGGPYMSNLGSLEQNLRQYPVADYRGMGPDPQFPVFPEEEER